CPTVILVGMLKAVGVGYSVNWPAVVTRPIWPRKKLLSANQSAPSGPVTMPCGADLAVGIVYSVMLSPAGVMRPILLAFCSVNHSASSGPTVMPNGTLPAVGMGRQVMAHAVVIRAMQLAALSVNHSAPSGPSTMPCGCVVRASVLHSRIKGGTH